MLTKNKTVLMIAHRLSTVQDADSIIVLSNGKITEQGSHESLLAQHGVYAAMWEEYQRSARWRVETSAEESAYARKPGRKSERRKRYDKEITALICSQ